MKHHSGRARATFAELRADYQAIVAVDGRQGWLALLTHRRAQRLARARARRLAGYPPRKTP